MSKNNINDWQDISLSNSSHDDWQDLPFAAQDPGKLETIAGKLSNGASLGFVDEISGGLEALGQSAGIQGLGGKIKDLGFSEDGPTLDFEKLKEAYLQGRDKERFNQNQMSESHPILSGISDVVGSFATAPLTGGATLGARVASTAGIGAVAGLGSSDAEDFSGMAKDAAIGGALGGALQYGGEKIIAPALSKVGQWINENGPTKVLGKVLAGVDPKATENYLKNSADVNKAKSLGDIADAVLNPESENSVLNELRNKIAEQSNQDWKALGRDTVINKQDLLSVGEDFANTILKGRDGSLTRTQATGADADALRSIYKELDSIKAAYGESLSEADLKSIVQSLQKKAFGSDTYSQDKVKQLSGVFNDVLKSGNPEYASSVAQTADTTSALKQIQAAFQNRQSPESYDKFNKAVKDLINKDEKSFVNQAVDKIQDNTGYDLRKDIVDSWTNSQFNKADTNGARKTLFGGVIGSAVGGPTGSAIGGAAGYSMDKYAGEVFKKILNSQISATQGIQEIAPFMGKFAKPLMEAAQRGGNAVAATHFILQQTNQEYRQKMQDMNKGQ